MDKDEKHFTSSDTVRDVVLGMADGLTVPFALAAGISGAVDSVNLIITAGLAEIAAGAISMGLGGYLAAKTYEENYNNEYVRELYEIDNLREREREETREIFRGYGLESPLVESIVTAMEKNKGSWADFMMRYELGLERPNIKRAPISALTIGVSYIIGGLVPLSSYMLIPHVHTALMVSIASTITALGIFGGIKGKILGSPPFKSAWQTMAVGGLAAAVAYGFAVFISH